MTFYLEIERVNDIPQLHIILQLDIVAMTSVGGNWNVVIFILHYQSVFYVYDHAEFNETKFIQIKECQFFDIFSYFDHCRFV